jgi:hypothetical protein
LRHSDEEDLLGGSLPRSFQVRARQGGRVAAARLVNVYVHLWFSREQLIDGGLTEGGGARPATLRVRLHFREREGDVPFLALLVAAPLLFVTLRFFGVPLLAGVPYFGFFGAGAGVDTSQVERVGLREAAQVEPYDDPIGAVLERGGTANPGLAPGAQVELGATTVVRARRVVFLLALGAAPAAPHHQEDGRKRDDGEQE